MAVVVVAPTVVVAAIVVMATVVRVGSLPGTHAWVGSLSGKTLERVAHIGVAHTAASMR